MNNLFCKGYIYILSLDIVNIKAMLQYVQD
jgi:hypothetical protein